MPRSHLPTPGPRRAISAVGAIAAIALGAGTGPVGGPSDNSAAADHGRPVAAPAARARRVAAAGPVCVPSSLNASAVLPGTNVQASPLPGSRDASPNTQVSLLGVPAARLSRIIIRGSSSGLHNGALRGYSQGDGASFIATRPYNPGESVSVSGIADRHAFAYSFTVSVPDTIPRLSPGKQPTGRSGEVQSYRSRPDLRPPTITVTTRASSLAPGLLFAAPYTGPGQDGPMIFDNTGQPVWFFPLRSGVEATNLQVQQFAGRPVLTYWQGYVPPQGFGQGVEIIDDSAYRTIAVVHAGNGFAADLHDFHITGADTAYLTVFNPIHCNLSAFRGPAASAVSDGVFQQLDLRTGLVRQEWHSLDHVSLGQSHQPARTTTTQWPLDGFHINSAVPLAGGRVLVSARSTWSVYQVSAITGQVVASIGGAQSSVKLGSGTATAWQHDAEALPDGSISIFDNGATPTVEPQSRGIIERVDSASNSVSLVRQYVHSGPALSSASQGNFQTLPNNDAFLGWGSQPYFTEFSPSGSVVFDARMPAGDQSYRGYRFPWSGTPAHGPSLAVARARHGVQVCMSWNGATEVAGWRVLAGSSSRAMTAVASPARSGFETCAAVASAARYYQARAVDSAGRVLRDSSVVRL